MFDFTGTTKAGVLQNEIDSFLVNRYLVGKRYSKLKNMQKDVLESYSHSGLSINNALQDKSFFSSCTIDYGKEFISINTNGAINILDIYVDGGGALTSNLSEDYNVSFTPGRIIINLFGTEKLDIPKQTFVFGRANAIQITKAIGFDLNGRPIRVPIKLREGVGDLGNSQSKFSDDSDIVAHDTNTLKPSVSVPLFIKKRISKMRKIVQADKRAVKKINNNIKHVTEFKINHDILSSRIGRKIKRKR